MAMMIQLQTVLGKSQLCFSTPRYIAASLDEDAQIPFPSILCLLAPPAPHRTTEEIRAGSRTHASAGK